MSDRVLTKPDYGQDAPGIVRTLLVLGPLLLIFAAWNPLGVRAIATAAAIGGAMCVVEGVWMIYGSRIGKLGVRDHLLDAMSLAPDARVLDVGCGHGLLLVGAAKRAPNGRAVGIDLWSQKDQGDNSRDATLANAKLEGVTVEVVDGDMTKMPFPDGAFDAVVANLAIHNVPSREGRRAAIREIFRVLAPGGQVALSDFQKTSDYADDLREAGMADPKISGPLFAVFPPLRIVTGTKT